MSYETYYLYMKNYWHCKKFNNLQKNILPLLLILALALNTFLPTLAEAEENSTSTDTGITESTETNTAEISTGDAVAGLNQESVVNTNEINTTTAKSDEETTSTSTTDTISSNSTTTEENQEDRANSTSTNPTPSETASSTTDTESAVGTSTENTAPTNLSVDIDNAATSTNDATTTANTGNNSITDNGTSTIETNEFVTETGDAVAYVDLTNVINTNIVNSTGLIDFIREVLGYENFDMRDTFMDIFNSLNTAESTAACGEVTCDPNTLLVNLINQANIYNNISVTANTGGNSATGTGSITTGDAYASANVVNMANTNIVDSNYLLLVFNNFSDLAGSLVLPNSDFFQTFFNQNQSQSGQFNFSNSANVNNNVDTTANTGNNSITGNGTSTIETGNSTSLSHTENIINQNFLNSNSFSMLIRVHGDWTGNIFGLPDGMGWEMTSEGIRLFYSPEGANSQNSSTIANITNDATVTNNVNVFALTGDNKISGNNGTSQIETGDAIADSTIMNIVNTNVVGSNWINLIFNIYGNWSGDIAFGQPDLWLGLSAEGNNRMVMGPGNELSYTYTIFNRGDVAAKNVILESEFPLSSLALNSNFTDHDSNDGKTVWSIGNIKAGETKEITVPAKIADTYGQNGQLPLPLSAVVYGDQKDANSEDNSDTLMIYVGKDKKQKDQPSRTFPAKFVIEKSADKTQAEPGDSVNYTIKLTNRGGPVFDSLLVDTLRDADGNILSEQEWPLEKIKNDETITITYTINLPKDLKDGIYTNTAQLVGLHGSKNKKYQIPYESAIVHHKLAVGDLPQGEVLGLSVSTCSPYITTYLRQYGNNDPEEVIKLQNFLKQYVDGNVDVTGIFDTETRLAVESFQQQYASDILAPWNMSTSSGYVYFTTQKKINEIMCGGTIEFPLTSEQEKEINYFQTNKNRMNSNDWLYSVNNNEETNNNTNALLPNNYDNLPAFLRPGFQLNSDISYLRLNNWRYLFRGNGTAFLD